MELPADVLMGITMRDHVSCGFIARHYVRLSAHVELHFRYC